MPPKPHSKRSKVSVIRFIYLYLITAITFITFIIGAVNIVDTGLKSFVFQVDDYDYARPPMPDLMCEQYAGLDDKSYEICLEKQRIGVEKEEIIEKRGLSNDAKRRLSIGIAQVLVAFPLWLFHWRIIERDRKQRRKK
ncbi:hypothetical protein ACFLZH_05850 [Patescibacteria group bacterium]